MMTARVLLTIVDEGITEDVTVVEALLLLPVTRNPNPPHRRTLRSRLDPRPPQVECLLRRSIEWQMHMATHHASQEIISTRTLQAAGGIITTEVYQAGLLFETMTLAKMLTSGLSEHVCVLAALA